MKFNIYLTDELQLIKHIENKLKSHPIKTYKYANVPYIRAGVLIPLFFKQGEPHILFTKRSDKVEHHKGQIAFPGGRYDDEDKDICETALRETWEEMGIPGRDVKILGRTDDFLTNTNFMITPYIGVITYPYYSNPNTDEIEDVYEIPLRTLIDPEIFEVKTLFRNGYNWKVHYYHCDNILIWGVTGFLVSNFLSIVFNINRMDL